MELTASLRCGLQRYKYKSAGSVPVIIDLEYGSQGACTIQREHDVDTVFSASFEKVDDYTVRGYRLTNGWALEQHVYFYTTFSSPIKECRLFLDNECVEETSALKGRNVKAILTFENPEKILDVKSRYICSRYEGC